MSERQARRARARFYDESDEYGRVMARRWGRLLGTVLLALLVFGGLRIFTGYVPGAAVRACVAVPFTIWFIWMFAAMFRGGD